LMNSTLNEAIAAAIAAAVGMGVYVSYRFGFSRLRTETTDEH